MKKQFFSVFLMLLLMASLSFFPTQRARAVTWTVTSTNDAWGTCPHSTDCTLRTAISWSSSGDTINFAVSGTITISLGAGFWVDKSLVIDGAGQNVIIDAGNTTGTVFDFVAGSSGSTLRNITVQGSSADNNPLIAIYAANITIGPGVIVQNNAATGGVGISILNSGAMITGIGGSTTIIQGNRGNGIYVSPTGGLTVEGNVTVRNNNGDGIAITSGTGTVSISGTSLQPVIIQDNGLQGINVLRNSVTIGPHVQANNNAQNGIQFTSNITSGIVIGSVVQNNGQNGILIYDAGGIVIQGNLIQNNGRNGIAVSGSSLPATTSLQILENTIIRNAEEGINFWGTGGNIVQNNYIGTNSSLIALANQNSGIAMVYGASNNILQGNTIGYNAFQNVLISGRGTNNNTLRGNIIFSGACNNPATNDNTGVVIIHGAQYNTIGPDNRIYCHRYDGIQVVGPNTDNNQIIDNRGGTVTNCTLAGVTGSVIACNGRGISIINEYGNEPFPSVSPNGSSRPNGPDQTLVQRNLVAHNNFDGLYSVLTTNTTIGGTFADANTFQGNIGNGALIVGSTGSFVGNQVLGNGADGIRLEPHYGFFSDGRDPITFADDIVSVFDIRNNIFRNNKGAGIHGVDNEADPAQTPSQLSSHNTFSGNVRARVVQEWFGAVEALDSANNPINTLSSGAISAAPGTCGTTYPLQAYNSGAWGPAGFILNNVGTWYLIMDDYVNNDGVYVNCNPHTVSASTGTMNGVSLFSFDGNASTHPVSPDPGIPYARPSANMNSRYQVAQVVLQLFSPTPAPTPTPTPTPAPTYPSAPSVPALAEKLPTTGFPKGRITSLAPLRTTTYTVTEIVLEIPSLNIKAPILGVPKSGDSWDVSWLGNSVGWLEGSAFPTWRGNTVLTAHVWNADNTPGLFYQIKNLMYGDRLYIHAFGQTHVYEVRENTRLWGDRRIDKVFKHEKLDWVTLLTCEGYNPLTGNYLFRRIVRAVLVEVK